MKAFSKIAMISFALFISNGLFAQGKSAGRGKAHVDRVTKPRDISTRENARVNGSVNANANANDIAKSKANSNSVLNSGVANPLPRERKHRRIKHHRRHS